MHVRRLCLLGLSVAVLCGCGGHKPQPAAKPIPPAVVPVDPFTQLLYRFQEGKPLPEPQFQLATPGEEIPVEYTKFGKYEGVGTANFSFTVTDEEGLKKALGEGIYPNEADLVKQDPAYQELEKKGELAVPKWDALRTATPEAAFFVWATAEEEPGVKQYNAALALEKAGLLIQALKGYNAVLVNFSTSYSHSVNGDFIWYLAPVALANMQRITRDYPELGWEYVGGAVIVENDRDTDISDDIVKVTPGKWIRKSIAERKKERIDLASLKIVETRGKGPVQLVKFENGHWQMRVDGKPYVVRGITYNPTTIGEGPVSDSSFAMRWQYTDLNKNGKIDAAYEAWVDADGNGTQDENEPEVGDFQLLKDMGVNTIRMYAGRYGDVTYDSSLVNKELLRDLYRTYGIRVIMGNFLGAYCVGSGATWEQGTDYTDPKQRECMKSIVRAMVMDLKDEPFVLMWVLGNENNMVSASAEVNASRTNAGQHPKVWAEFLNEVATMIHEIDPKHPVAVGNLENGMADVYAQYAPALDVFGINSYRGQYGFGSLWVDTKRLFDRPILITEYGCDAFSFQLNAPDEEAQARSLEASVRDMTFNQAGGPYAGNCIGGVLFEYLDEWWKDAYSGGEGEREDKHQYNCKHKGPMPDERFHEEWFGIVGQGSGKHSPFERVLRKAYAYYKSVWNG